MEELERKVRMLMGIPPHNQPSNICWNDGYFYRSLVIEYGEKAVIEMQEKLKKENS